jgi:ubiquinone/menaquinone biosynthesis C-methylase UbiE
MKYIDIVNEIDEYHKKNKIITKGIIYKDIFTKINNYYPLDMQIKNITNLITNKKSKLNKKHIDIVKEVLLENQIYPNNKSNYQIQYLIDQYKNYNDINIFVELVNLLSSRLDIKKMTDFVDILLEKERTDNEYYKLMKSYKIHYEDRYISRSEEIYYFIQKYCKYKIEKYLDYGCGSGKKTADIAKLLNLKKENTFCADIDEWSIYGKNKNSNTTPVEIIPNKSLNIEDNSIDLITTTHVLHHINSLDFVIKELYRILKNNCYLVVTEHDVITINENILVDIEHVFFERVMYNNFKEIPYMKCINYIELDIMLMKYGFTLVDCKYYDEGNIRDKKLPTRSYIAIYKKINKN